MSEEEKVTTEENAEENVEESKEETFEQTESVEDENTEEVEEVKEDVTEEKKEEKPEPKEDAVDYKDRWMRVTAEYQNYRTRTQKEKADLYETASFDICKDLVSVIDNFDLALKNIEDEKTKEGIELIRKQLWSILEKNHVKEIPAMDLKVDLSVHNKIAEIPFEGKEEGIIVDVTKKGYTQGDRVIRPADVVVSR